MAYRVWSGRRLTKDEIESFLREARIARFCSHNNDGTIHAAPVWFKYENEKIVILTPEHSRKAGNVRRNKNVSILIDVEKPSKGVLVYGRAELDDEFDLESNAVSMAEKYMSKEKAKEQWRTAICPPTTSWLKISVRPERVASFDYSHRQGIIEFLSNQLTETKRDLLTFLQTRARWYLTRCARRML